MIFGDTAFKQSIRERYTERYPTDELGAEIAEKATFEGLFDTLDYYGDVYEYIGVSDSLVRERCFQRLADIIEKPYMYVYDQYMKRNQYIKRREN